MTVHIRSSMYFENLLNEYFVVWQDLVMIEVRRESDNELCGFVVESGQGWNSLTVFGGLLEIHPSQKLAETHVLDVGLASLSSHWYFRSSAHDDWQICCIQEASPSSVTIALDYYSMPGVPIVKLNAEDFAQGAELVHEI